MSIAGAIGYCHSVAKLEDFARTEDGLRLISLRLILRTRSPEPESEVGVRSPAIV